MFGCRHLGMSSQQLPPSRRALKNIKPDLMLDLSREMADIPAYDEKAHPEGLIDITSSINALMIRELEQYVKTKVSINLQDGEIPRLSRAKV